MEEKPVAMEASQEIVKSEKMECDEVLSQSETAESTENTDSSGKVTGTEKKLSVGSESTSGIEAGSRSTTSESEVPSEGAAVSDNVVERVEDQTTGMSPPAKKTLLGNIKEFFSPPKDPKSIKEKPGSKSKGSRSKSMSPSKKTPPTAASEVSNIVEEACVVSEGEEEHLKKGNEKSGVIKSLRKHLSKMITRSRSSAGSENTNLVSDEETEEPAVVEKPPEKKIETAEANEDAVILQWTENRQSLTEKPSLDGTTMTDIPSTWSGADVFPSDASSKHSEMGENTSEEGASGSLVSSPDEKVSEQVKEAGSECIKDLAAEEKAQDVEEAVAGSLVSSPDEKIVENDKDAGSECLKKEDSADEGKAQATDKAIAGSLVGSPDEKVSEQVKADQTAEEAQDVTETKNGETN